MGKRSHEYNAYLNSARWQTKRKIALAAAGNHCSACGVVKPFGKGLHVHHLTYQRFGIEKMSDLQVLCADCHMELHGKTKPAKRKRKRGTPTPRSLGTNPRAAGTNPRKRKKS